MKTKVLVISHAMELGGAERALLGLLDHMDEREYEADLFLMRHQGELLQYLPEKVHLLPEIDAYACLAVPVTEVWRKRQFGVLIGRIMGKFLAALFVKQHHLKTDNGVALEYSHKYTRRFMPRISEKEYDLVISFLTPHYFGAKKVRAKKRAAWIHTDYAAIEVDVKSEEKMWDAYDHIVSISEDCSRGFTECFPKLAEKIIRVDNIVPAAFVRQQAESFDVAEEMPRDGSVRILSVGRFCHAKNFDNVPDICSRLNELLHQAESGSKEVKWYLIGFGPDEELIRERIREAGMEESVIILGKKANPYPYMKECDLYVQPSRYEGNCVCVHEAAALGKKVVITEYATSGSQFYAGEDGVIVPMDNPGCAEGIYKLIV